MHGASNQKSTRDVPTDLYTFSYDYNGKYADKIHRDFFNNVIL